ncbi:MAG: family hydrolase [Glaciihabitans sp.]|nr:family hydrolase [Glaciihabitans sp.]
MFPDATADGHSVSDANQRPAAVFLDLDATILDEAYVEMASVAACVEFAAAHPGLEPLALAGANYEVWIAYWPEIEDDWILGNLSTDELRLEVWRRTLARFGHDDEALVAEIAAMHHRNEITHYRAFDDVIPFLDAMQSAGVRVGVLTNGASDTQREKLVALGIADRFDAIMVSGELGVAKPDPAVFERALEAIGASADEAAHVGDSVFADVGGSVASGLTSVWLNRESAELKPGDARPNHEVRSLNDLIELWIGAPS